MKDDVARRKASANATSVRVLAIRVDTLEKQIRALTGLLRAADAE